MICPPESAIQKLLEAAQIGDIIEIRGIVDAMEASTQAYATFVPQFIQFCCFSGMLVTSLWQNSLKIHPSLT